MRPRWCLRSGGLTFAVAAALCSTAAGAQDYPSQDIRLVCAFPAGSGADVMVRYFAEKLRPMANRTVIVENKVGAGGNIAAEFVVKAKPDGHTIFVHTGSSVAANQSLFRKPPFDAAKDIRIAATINRQPFLLVVDAKSPYKTVADLTAAMKQKGDKASYATNNTSGRVMGALYKQAAGLSAVEVNYRAAADTLNDLAGGKLDYALHDPIFGLAQQREGRIRLLAVGSAKRFDAVADLPTMAESGIPMELTNWFAAMVPAATPKPVVDQIHRWFVQMVSTDETKAFLNKFGGDPFITTPEQAHELFMTAIREWGDYVRIAKIEPLG
jgi:tripartite-type tricarboxylate transporter receptor subunit TctC